MTLIFVILAVVFVIGVAIGLYAWLAPRAVTAKPEPLPPIEPFKPSPDWTSEAGEEFSGLGETARCDLVFAVADLDDERSARLLIHALDDPSDAVALAAAHALARRGATNSIEDYAARHPGERAQRIVATLALLD